MAHPSAGAPLAAEPIAVPGWVPSALRDDYLIIAIEDGEEAAASYARRKKVGAVVEDQRIDIAAQLPGLGKSVTSDAYLAAMRDLAPGDHSVRSVVRVVAVVTGYTVSELLSQQRALPLVRARHIAAFIAMRLGVGTLSFIGRQMGGRDHTTMISAQRRVAAVVKAHGLDWTDDVVEMARCLWGLDWTRTAR